MSGARALRAAAAAGRRTQSRTVTFGFGDRHSAVKLLSMASVERVELPSAASKAVVLPIKRNGKSIITIKVRPRRQTMPASCIHLQKAAYSGTPRVLVPPSRIELLTPGSSDLRSTY